MRETLHRRVARYYDLARAHGRQQLRVARGMSAPVVWAARSTQPAAGLQSRLPDEGRLQLVFRHRKAVRLGVSPPFKEPPYGVLT